MKESSSAYYSIKYVSKEDHDGKLEGGIGPYVASAYCHNHVKSGFFKYNSNNRMLH